MKLYELTYLISPDLSGEELKTFSQKIDDIIREEGGVLIEGKNPVKKELNYPIKKKKIAYLTVVNFHLDPTKLEILQKKLKAKSQILRYLLIAKKLAKKVPSVSIKPPKKIFKKPEEKVELGEIEKKLEEILGET